MATDQLRHTSSEVVGDHAGRPERPMLARKSATSDHFRWCGVLGGAVKGYLFLTHCMTSTQVLLIISSRSVFSLAERYPTSLPGLWSFWWLKLHAKRVWQPSTWTEIASPRGLPLLLVEDDLFGCQSRKVHVFVNPTLVATIHLFLKVHDNHLADHQSNSSCRSHVVLCRFTAPLFLSSDRQPT